MVQAYCTKCKEKTEALNLEFYKTNSRNKCHIHKGKCSVCDTNVAVILKEKL